MSRYAWMKCLRRIPRDEDWNNPRFGFLPLYEVNSSASHWDCYRALTRLDQLECQKYSRSMSISGYKRLTIVLGVLCIGLLVLCGSLFRGYGSLKIRVAFASEQAKIFEEMRSRALISEPTEAARCLEYVVNYYPSGSKQEAGSRLDRMVEHERALARRDIITHLCTKTGEDLGINPEAWIQKYAKR